MSKVTDTHFNAWPIAFLAFLVPGFGHIVSGRVARGALSGAAIWGMFLIGILLGGHLYGLFDAGEGFLSKVFAFCNLGSGLLYAASRFAGVGVNEQAHLATSEYGNVFLMVAGLLNYLLALDAFDIRSGRKV
ncbi:MAG: hypothetical protein H0T60_16520 [Acidobacteria bacterium]|nr:hypothetical protein [Acidobacteriota bacterium]